MQIVDDDLSNNLVKSTILIVKKKIYQIKLLNEINFFLIIICILIQFKVSIYFP